MKCININYLSFWHTLSMYVIVQISLSFMRFLKCYSLPFPAFMTVLTDTHSRGVQSTDHIIQCVYMGIY